MTSDGEDEGGGDEGGCQASKRRGPFSWGSAMFYPNCATP